MIFVGQVHNFHVHACRSKFCLNGITKKRKGHRGRLAGLYYTQNNQSWGLDAAIKARKVYENSNAPTIQIQKLKQLIAQSYKQFLLICKH